jgi:hypothetical protein
MSRASGLVRLCLLLRLHLQLTEAQNIWEKNVEEHHMFAEPLDACWLYLRRCRAALSPAPQPATSPVPAPSQEVEGIDMSAYPTLNSTRFDPNVLRKHMDTFITPLAAHLTEEIDTLTPEIMLRVGQEGDKLLRAEMQKVMMAYEPSWFLCSVFGS